jgi:hypothetical protein
MAELTVRQGELVVTVKPSEKRRLTWFGLRTSRSKILDGNQVRIPVAKVAGVRVTQAYWELPEQMDIRDTERAAKTKGTYEAPETQPWVGIFQATTDGATKKKLCFIYGQYSPVVAVDLNEDAGAPFASVVVSCLPYQTDSIAASIKTAAGLT